MDLNMKLPQGLARVLAGGIAPALARWGACHEKAILREGESLAPALLEFASELGIEFPDEIRVMKVDRIPLPVPAGLVSFARWMGLPVFAPIGMALGRGIYFLPGHDGSLPHELVHVLQYQRLGMSRFMETYIFQCLAGSYADAPMEREARERSGG
jgi:hypothetical protein